MRFPLRAVVDTTLLVSNCRILPSDASWPNVTVWNALNKTLDGQLIKTIPLGSVCHQPSYDATQCTQIQNSWHSAALHEESPSSIMDPVPLNKSCDPFTAIQTPCTIGAYVQYAVNVSEPQHVIKTLDFVKKHNIRFVVKNTGHDYMGRSTGTGAVSVWMHNLREINFVENYNSSKYTGPAFKVNAGVLGSEITAAANNKGFVVVGGECPSTGFAGGFIQGGGHSVLSSIYGLAADQTLSFEVITPNGGFVIASPYENTDLYWALSGGGAGTYGVVWSITVKAHRDTPVTATTIQFSSQGISQDAYWNIISTYLSLTRSFPPANTFAFAIYSNASFYLPLFSINRTIADVETLLAPLISAVDQQGLKYVSSATTFPTYLAAFSSVPTFQNSTVGTFQIGNRLLPVSLWKDNSTLATLVNVLRGVAGSGGGILDVTVHPGLKVAGYPDNAVLPAWRDTLHSVFITLPLGDQQSTASIIQDQYTIAETFLSPLRQLTPGSGAYMNEGALKEPNFKTAFYGSNYPHLLSIKDKYDPDQIMYGSINVGGDRWVETDDGRLCRTSKS